MSPDPAAAAFWAAYIRNRNVDERTAADGALPVAGGYALYVAGTHFDRVIGAGWDEPLEPDDFAVVEEFYAGRGTPPSFELRPEAVERDAAALAERGYRIDEDDASVIYEIAVPAPVSEPAIAVRTTRNRRAWVALLNVAFSEGSDDAELRQTLQFLAAGASILTIASLDGRDVGAGAILIIDEFALLIAGGVLPDARRQGVHQALVAARLRIAYERGATRAAVKTVPGSPVERTAARAGFTRTALTVRATRAATPSLPSP
jgi:GNAT superfamily N-acetyltransferase